MTSLSHKLKKVARSSPTGRRKQIVPITASAKTKNTEPQTATPQATPRKPHNQMKSLNHKFKHHKLKRHKLKKVARLNPTHHQRRSFR